MASEKSPFLREVDGIQEEGTYDDMVNVGEEPPEIGLLGSTVLLCATTLGAGILAIPLTFGLLGVGIGISTIIFFGFCTVYSIYLLLVTGQRAKVKSYEGLMEAAFPGKGKIITTIFINVLIFGALVGFLVIISDIVRGVITYVAAGSQVPWYLNQDAGMIIIAILVVFPLSLVRDISKLEYSSFAAIFIIGTFTFIIIILGIKMIHYDLINWDAVSGSHFTISNLFKATPIVSLAYTCQMSVFPIWKELRQPTIRRMNMVQISSNIFSGLLYCLMGYFGFIISFPGTPPNILLAMPNDRISYLIIRIAFGIAIVFHYPVVHFAFRNSIEVTIFRKNSPNYRFSYIRHFLETLIVMALSAIVAIFLKELNKVFDLTGAIAGYPVDFVFPCLCYAKIMFYNDGPPGAPFMEKMKRLLVPQMIPAFFMFIIAFASSFISLYVTITEEF